MKKSILFIASVLIYTVTVAQNDYSRGFEKGYKAGYCYNDYSCTTIAPPCPPPYAGESWDSWQDGYNRGFKMGSEDKQAKKSENSTQRSSSNNYSSSGVFTPQEYVSTYVAPNYDLINSVESRLFALSEERRAYRDDLSRWVLNLKTQTDEKLFIEAMNEYYSELQNIDTKNLGKRDADLNSIKNNIEKEIDEYSTRAKKLSNKLRDSKNNSCPQYLYSTNLVDYTIPDFRYLFSTKTSADKSKISTTLPENAVLYVVEEPSDNSIFYLVCYNGIQGYISKYFLVKY